MKKVFGERIQELRKDKKITQTKIGKILGVRKETISKWENNKFEPDIETIKKLAELLDTTVGYLVGETDNPKQNIEPTAEELYQKLIEQNPNNSVHFYNADDLTEEDFKIIQNAIDTLRAKNKIK